MSIIKSRPHRKNFWPMRPATGDRPPTSSTTDDIPSPTEILSDGPAPLVRQQSLPIAAGDQWRSRGSSPFDISIPSHLQSPSLRGDVNMTGHATITFSQAGLQPPVYVVTSLSEPPWTTLEMAISGETTEAGDPVFRCDFDAVAEGSYQYKVRIGEGYWVVDESKETAADEAGNRNNVVHTETTTDSYDIRTAPDATAKERRWGAGAASSPQGRTPSRDRSQDVENKDVSKANEERQNSVQLPIVPLPFVVVDKVEDQAQTDYSDTQPETLATNTSKRAADADPDYESIKYETPVEPKETPESPPIALVVVEKADDKPAFGEDFGDDATSAQKLAYELRTADSVPDHVVVNEQKSDGELGATQLSNDAGNANESNESGELDQAPLLSHEASSTGDVSNGNELEQAPLLSHETGFGPDSGEFEQVPLLSHETGLETERKHPGDFGNAPLLSHETELSTSDLVGAEEGGGEYDARDDVPLIPPERSSDASEAATSDGARSQNGFPTHTQGSDSLFPAARSGSFLLKQRSHSSNLPHRLPRSDADDEDLHDPSLEPFPTGRDPILHRIATIGKQYPEDETADDLLDTHSLQYTVLSQACSSVDLPPVDSYASLRDVHREALLEEDEEEDVTSFGSPALELASRVGAPGQQASATRLANGTNGDELATSEPQNKALDLTNEDGNSETGPDASSQDHGEGVSAQQSDGAGAGDKSWDKLYDSLATPANVLQPLQSLTQTSGQESRTVKNDNAKTDAVAPAATEGNELRKRKSSALSPNKTAAPNQMPPSNLLKNLLETLFGPILRAINACLGREKDDSPPIWFWWGVVFMGAAVAWTFVK